MLKIEPVGTAPSSRMRARRETNLLTYGPSTVLVANRGGRFAGSIRYALRAERGARMGMITDLRIGSGIPLDQVACGLINEAERRLGNMGVRKIEAMLPVMDPGFRTFEQIGFRLSRRTVTVGWALAESFPDVVSADKDLSVPREDPDPREMADLIVDSDQPYWQWWREPTDFWLLDQGDYRGTDHWRKSHPWRTSPRARVWRWVARSLREQDHVFFLARGGGRLIAMCDASISDRGRLDLGLVLLPDLRGHEIGYSLVNRALSWLRSRGIEDAEITVTSGLDEYDPAVQLYLELGGHITAESTILVKRLRW